MKKHSHALVFSILIVVLVALPAVAVMVTSRSRAENAIEEAEDITQPEDADELPEEETSDETVEEEIAYVVSDETGEPVVYIGQAGERKNGEGILHRLQEHKKNPDKDYWTEAVVFTTAGNTFGPTEISYLENRFCSIAVEAKRYLVKNANDPTQGHVTEEKESELEEFIDYAKVIMGTLGHKVFTPVNSLVAPADGNSPNVNQQFFLKTSKVDASGKRVSDGFVVLKGSKIALLPTKSCPNWTKQLRTRYQDKIDDSGILIDDLSFTSPSAAAGFVNYASANGLTSWVTADGRTLKSIESTEE